MSKSALWCGVVFLTVVLVCGLPFFTRVWIVPHPAAIQGPSLASASPVAAAVVPTASLTPKQADTDAEQARRERLQTDRRELKLANNALEAARQKAEADKKRAEKHTEVMAELNAKLLDTSLKVPQTLSEAASLMGRDLADTAKFNKKWGGSIPAAGTAEADEYAREQDELVTQTAALLKFMTDENKATPLGQPDGLARFQAASLADALGLRDEQAQGLNTALDGYYQQFFSQSLSMDAAPQTGPDATRQWHQQRATLSEQAYAAVGALLTPEQAAAFHGLYPTAGTYLTENIVGSLVHIYH